MVVITECNWGNVIGGWLWKDVKKSCKNKKIENRKNR
jgi:hypothetical protein